MKARILVLSALIFTLGARPAVAGEDLNASDQSLLVTVSVGALPFLLVSVAARGVAELSSADPIALPQKVTAVAPMKVTAVRVDNNGRRIVELEGAAATDANRKASLVWAKGDQDPTAGFVIGETVEFSSSQSGSGWLIRNAAGEALAFAPTANAAKQVLSERW